MLRYDWSDILKICEYMVRSCEPKDAYGDPWVYWESDFGLRLGMKHDYLKREYFGTNREAFLGPVEDENEACSPDAFNHWRIEFYAERMGDEYTLSAKPEDIYAKVIGDTAMARTMITKALMYA